MNYIVFQRKTNITIFSTFRESVLAACFAAVDWLLWLQHVIMQYGPILKA